jgi:hypothetical protein
LGRVVSTTTDRPAGSHWKLSISVVESSALSPASHVANRMVKTAISAQGSGDAFEGAAELAFGAGFELANAFA